MAKEEQSPRLQKALRRYEIISAYIAMKPPRGQRRALLKKLAASHKWVDEKGNELEVSPETLRVWVRRYNKGGLDALKDAERPQRGVIALPPATVQLILDMKEEVPKRSIRRIIRMAEEMKLVEPGTLKKSTVHRVLRSAGISRQPKSQHDTQDLDRFEANFANELWQSDMLVGPWLPDPYRPGKVRRAYLYAFIDDHSRNLLYGRFFFKGDLPALELVLKRCFQRYGVPTILYYDNGAVYRADHMKYIVGKMGIHPIVYTTVGRPQGHGKIESLNHTIRNHFLSELACSNITTLEALNEAFWAWSEMDYNRTVHSETGETPRDRWRASSKNVKYADEQKLIEAFKWTEKRTSDKAGVFSLFNIRFQVGPDLASRRFEVRYEPEDLSEIEVWHNDRFIERLKPFKVNRHRRSKAASPDTVVAFEEQKDAPLSMPLENGTLPEKKPTVDWLGHLVKKHKTDTFYLPEVASPSRQSTEERRALDAQVISMLRDVLDPEAFDADIAQTYLDRYGPFKQEVAEEALHQALKNYPNDQHVSLYLDAIRQAHQGDLP